MEVMSPVRGRVKVVVCGGAVEADQGVEVDDPAALELRDLRELHPHLLAGCCFCQPEPVGDAWP